MDRRYVVPRWNLFRLYSARQDWSLAQKELLEIIRARPDDFAAFAELGTLRATRLSDRAGAIEAWQRSLQLNPDQPDLRKALESIR